MFWTYMINIGLIIIGVPILLLWVKERRVFVVGHFSLKKRTLKRKLDALWNRDFIIVSIAMTLQMMSATIVMNFYQVM